MGFATALFVFLLVTAAEAKEYVVGGSGGWATGVDYSSWASSSTFNVGDTLVFQYGGLHTVNEVSESDYSACSASNAIQSFGNQNTRITLTAPGTRYFICGTTGHCSEGMKLAVTVSASASASSSTTPGTGSSFTPTTPGTGSSFTPTTPEGSTTTTPSQTTPYSSYQPYGRPFYNSGTGIRIGFYGLLLAVFVVITLLNG